MVFETSGDPCELDGYGIAADFEQLCTQSLRSISDPTEDPELIGSASGE